MAVLCVAILARDCLCCLITMRSWEECGGGRASTYWKCTQCSLVLDIWPNAGGLLMGAAKGGPPKGLHPPVRSVIGKWKSIKAFHVSRHVLPLGDSIFPDFVLKTAQVCWPSSSNPSLPLSAPLTQRQLLQHMEQNLAWGRHSTWKISTQAVKVWPSYKQLEAASCIGSVQQLPNRQCYKLHQSCVYVYVHGNMLLNYNAIWLVTWSTNCSFGLLVLVCFFFPY